MRTEDWVSTDNGSPDDPNAEYLVRLNNGEKVVATWSNDGWKVDAFEMSRNDKVTHFMRICGPDAPAEARVMDPDAPKVTKIKFQAKIISIGDRPPASTEALKRKLQEVYTETAENVVVRNLEAKLKARHLQ